MHHRTLNQTNERKNGTSSLCKSSHMIYSYNKDLFLLWSCVCMCVLFVLFSFFYFFLPFPVAVVLLFGMQFNRLVFNIFFLPRFILPWSEQRIFDCILVFVFGCLACFRLVFDDNGSGGDGVAAAVCSIGSK